MKKTNTLDIQSSTDKFFFQYKFIPVYLLPALMIYVGLLGGASYVNIFYLLLHEDKYPEEDREFCINIVSLFITGGKQFCSYLYCQVQFLSLFLIHLIHIFVCSLNKNKMSMMCMMDWSLLQVLFLGQLWKQCFLTQCWKVTNRETSWCNVNHPPVSFITSTLQCWNINNTHSLRQL